MRLPTAFFIALETDRLCLILTANLFEATQDSTVMSTIDFSALLLPLLFPVMAACVAFLLLLFVANMFTERAVESVVAFWSICKSLLMKGFSFLSMYISEYAVYVGAVCTFLAWIALKRPRGLL